VTTGKLNTVNDTVIGGSESIGGRSRFAGQLGKHLWLGPEQIEGMYDPSVGTLYGGRFRYVRMRGADADSPAVAVGQILFWDTVVTNWQTRYQVTRLENLSSADNAVMIAGIYLGGFDTDNYGFIQDLGMVPVLFRANLTVAGAIGSRVYAAGAGAGADEGLADVLTADATSLVNQRYLGPAVTAPVASELDTVLLHFNNALGMVP
jgi:hypothetical protein